MRNMLVRVEPFIGYSSAKEAIHAGARINRLSRTIEDEVIRGRQITNVSWSDGSFTFNLDDDRSIHISLLNCNVLAQLYAKPLASVNHNNDDIFSIKFVFNDKTWQSDWNREEIAKKYIGKILTNLWFMSDRILFYTKDTPILSFSSLEIIPTGDHILHWHKWLD